VSVSRNERGREGDAASASAAGDERAFLTWDYPVFALLTILETTVFGYALFYWFVSRGPSSHPVVFGLLSIPLVMTIGAYEIRWLTLPLMSRPRPVPAREGWKVGVATTFVPGAEPIEMLESTLRAMVAMDYPHETWVLDEGDNEEVKALCQRLEVGHFTRRGVSRYQTEEGRFARRTKPGNYNAWLEEVGFSRYELIVAFDPDHMPCKEFLTEVLGYFDDPGVGFVQAAQVYYNQAASFVALGAAQETYAYYSSIQMTSYALGYPIVTGCHTAHRASALKEVGGFAPHDADDLLITILYRVAGWRGIYVPKKLAVGLVPVDWRGYITQQRRWARSVLDVKFRVFPQLAGRLPLLERITGFLHGLYYLHGLGTALTVSVLGYLLVTGIAPRVVSPATFLCLFLVAAVIQVCDMYRQRFFIDRETEVGWHWRVGVLRFAKWPYILLALKDTIFPRIRPYEITMKVKTQSSRFMLARSHLLVAMVLTCCWGVGMALGRIHNPLLHLAAGVWVLASIGVVLTELLTFPEPFDGEMCRRAIGASTDLDLSADLRV
jgi:cellulose synthase/poly-beta-1,6-N-acetylglucosamine synthase-like glycosyltransferase